MIFEIKSVMPIMDEADYPGIRIMLDTAIETMHTPLKIDFSTSDVITPREVSYSFRLLFEERAISILAYNLETVLAEKLETLLARGTANTQKHNIDNATLKEAFVNTSAKRGSIGLLSDVHLILKEVAESTVLIDRWKNYQRKFDYASDVLWADVMESAVDNVSNDLTVSWLWITAGNIL